MKGWRDRVSPRQKLLSLTVPPLVVWIAVAWLNGGLRPGPAHDTPEVSAAEVEQRFERLIADMSRVADDALRRPLTDLRAGLRPLTLRDRLEGLGVLNRNLRYIRWEGMPAEPRAGPPAAGNRYEVRVEGVRTRLVIQAGPGPSGRYAIASFIVDSTLGDLPFEELLFTEIDGEQPADVEFLDSEAAHGRFHHVSPAASGVVQTTLRAPDGTPLAMARVHAPAGDWLRARQRGEATAWALLVLVGLTAQVVDWRGLCSSWGGLASIGSALLVARATMDWAEIPARLFSRELGGPSLFGTDRAWLASPVDLLLTAGCVYLFCVATRVRCSIAARTSRLSATMVAVAFAAAATLVGVLVTITIARNSVIPLADRPAPFAADGRLLLGLGLLLVLLGAAELWALAISLPRIGRFPSRRGAGPIPVGLAFFPLIVGATLPLQLESDRLALDRAAHEVGPHLLEQRERRQLALRVALKEIRDRFERERELEIANLRPESLAFRYWAEGELAHSRYRSSLDLYDASGQRISRFGFGLPRVEEEAIDCLHHPSTDLDILEESVEIGRRDQRLLHGEVPLIIDGTLEAVAVVHIADDPGNLPFLPGSKAYLSVLGHGGMGPSDTSLSRLQYVLYDALGTVELTTLREPPRETKGVRDAAAANEPIPLRAGDEPYLGLALEQQNGKLHLLLVPRRTLVERIAGILRFLLLGVLLLGVITAATRLRAGPPHALIDMLRGSFYRKILAALLLASVPPLVGLAVFLQSYAERRADRELITRAANVVDTARRIVEDYAITQYEEEGEPGASASDEVLHWLATVVGQEIHTYDNGLLQATSMRELFSSGLVPRRLDGQVHRQLVRAGLPYIVLPTTIGARPVPVVYASVRPSLRQPASLVVAVPLLVEQRERERSVALLGEMILLATVALLSLLATAAAILARAVSRPVRELVGATGRIAAGDYGTRLDPTTGDEVAELVHGFNSMASALARQRSDLERRRDYIETLLRHATTGVISLDAEGRIVTMNPAASTLLDACAERLTLGAELASALRDCPVFSGLGEAIGTSARRPGVPMDVDLVKDEQPRRYRMVRVRLDTASGGNFGTLLLLDDVTDLMRSNQLAAWAEMARAIAHEIKNPLTPIQLSAEHLRRILHDRGVELTEAEDACIDTIIKQVRALYDIAGEFSAYAKLPVLAPESTDPVQFMQGMVLPYRTSSPPRVTIEESYEPAPAIAADPRVLSRAVVNLIENALQAMPDGGKLVAGVRFLDRDEQVELFVSDTGPGLAAEARLRLFEPYFSTKSSGTGLGLAIAQRAVEAHHGTIEVDSRPQVGTTFRIRIPTSRAA